jgi:hypothetical protein
MEPERTPLDGTSDSIQATPHVGGDPAGGDHDADGVVGAVAEVARSPSACDVSRKGVCKRRRIKTPVPGPLHLLERVFRPRRSRSM